MSGLRPGILVLALLGVLVAARPVQAVYECGGVQDTCVCGAANFCICCDNSTYGTAHGNCVWYAWHKACCEWGIGLQWCTNAETWDSYAQTNGYPVLSGPCADTVFVCEINTTQCGSGGYGHVGWVETAYPDGSIDVTEQGCYSWFGVKSRNINAQSASPAMKYIYEPGTSCSSCECTAGDTEQQGCGDCGTQSRTCGSDCQWGSWSTCQNEGPCSDGATDQQGCGDCGTQSRTCGSTCQWGSWSACQNEGPCSPGSTQGCGTCGGTQTCDSSCAWGICVESCTDGGVTVDAAAPTDGHVPADGAPPVDGHIPTDPDAGSPGGDGGAVDLDGPLVVGGCQCQAEGGGDRGGPSLLLLILVALLLRRRP